MRPHAAGEGFTTAASVAAATGPPILGGWPIYRPREHRFCGIATFLMVIEKGKAGGSVVLFSPNYGYSEPLK